jgi:hypothetical protein
MLVGHYSAGLIAKRIEPRLSLASVMLAAMLADFLWCLFLIAGLEEVAAKPGVTVLAGMRAIDVLEARKIMLSHSLAMDIVWAGVFAGAYFLWRRYAYGAFILFGAVLSHWLLDFVSHPPDMPLFPGVERYFGLGLWSSIRATVVVEGALWLIAILLYSSRTALTRSGKFVFFGGAGLLTLVWLGNIAGPPPSNLHTIGFSSLTCFSLTLVWAYSVERLNGKSSRPAERI